ncbi:Chorismate synthase [Stutzerimonas stutzeri]
MSGNTYGKLFTVTTAGESHGPALVAIVDGCPPGLDLSLEDLQRDLDRRKPGAGRHLPSGRKPMRWKFSPACSKARPPVARSVC